MKGFFTAAALLFFFSACKESGVQLSKPSTFVKYFGNGKQDVAIDVLETSDPEKGYLVLAHYDSAIHLTKTDLSGNVLWEQSYDWTRTDLSPSNFVAIKGGSDGTTDQGYVIVGTKRNIKYGARLFVMRVGIDGTLKDSISYHSQQFGDASQFRLGQGQYVLGRGVAQSSSSADFFVIGNIVQSDLVDSPVDSKGNVVDMFFAQIDGGTLDTVFTRTYGGGTSALANRLYLDFAQTSAYWGGTRGDDQGLHMRFIKSGFNTQSTIFDLSYPVGESGYTGVDFCSYGYGFAFIGNNPDKDISVAQVGSGGNLLDTLKVLSPNQLPLLANSICSTFDGGLLLLGSTTVDTQGTNTDYYLVKRDAAGGHQWTRTHGGKYPDVGVRVLQSSDGGYIVLGTTTLANVNTVFLMKTDSQGDIQ